VNESALTAPRGPLVFNWDPPRRRNLVLGGFIFASVAAHLAGFYIFQVVYPPTVALLPPPARLNLISASSEQGQSLLRWVEAEDPALASTTRRPPDAKAYALPKLEHVPSYFATEPALKEVPPPVVDLRIPSAQPPGMVPITRRQPPPPAVLFATSVVFSGDLQQLGPAKFPSANFKRSSNEAPQNARYQITVDRRGAVRYCFMLNSSGDTSLDEQARNYLTLCRFAPKPETTNSALVWGIAAIEWGNDVGVTGAKPTPATP
jgi:TonB family protein